MKGAIFNLFQEFVESKIGPEGYDDVIAQCNLLTNDPFVGPGTYPDEDFQQIVARSSKALKIPIQQVIRAFGRFSFPKLARIFPQYAEPFQGNAKGFLKTIDSVIHVEVMKLFKNVQLPRLYFEDPAPDALIMEYDSARKLCAFAEGLIDGTADFFGQKITQKQTQCMLHGGSRCRFELRFS